MTKVSIVIPVYNDNESLIKLIDVIDISELRNYTLNIIIVDDFSDNLVSPIFTKKKYKNIDRITVLRLKHNCGHQIAIQEGLRESLDYQSAYTVVMDGDGEDNPMEIPRLVSESINSQRVVVASRGVRYDSLI